MLFYTILRHRHCFLLSVATDGKDERGLNLEKVGPTFSILNAMPGKITKEFIMVLRGEICLIYSSQPTGEFCVWVNTLRNDLFKHRILPYFKHRTFNELHR